MPTAALQVEHSRKLHEAFQQSAEVHTPTHSSPAAFSLPPTSPQCTIYHHKGSQWAELPVYLLDPQLTLRAPLFMLDSGGGGSISKPCRERPNSYDLLQSSFINCLLCKKIFAVKEFSLFSIDLQHLCDKLDHFNLVSGGLYPRYLLLCFQIQQYSYAEPIVLLLFFLFSIFKTKF